MHQYDPRLLVTKASCVEWEQQRQTRVRVSSRCPPGWQCQSVSQSVSLPVRQTARQTDRQSQGQGHVDRRDGPPNSCTILISRSVPLCADVCRVSSLVISLTPPSDSSPTLCSQSVKIQTRRTWTLFQRMTVTKVRKEPYATSAPVDADDFVDADDLRMFVDCCLTGIE